MKFFIVLLALVAFVCAEFTEEEEKKWRDFKLQHGKMFLSSGKEKDRKKTFLKNARDVDEHNEKFLKGEVTYTKKVNKHSDLSEEEFLSRYGGVSVPADADNEKNKKEIHLRSTAPESLDLRTHSGINPVRSQSSCGSCWTFSTVAAIEYGYWRWHGETIDLSEQFLVDCVYGTSRSGCSGGWMPTAMDFIAANDGIPSEADYPYTAVWGTCKNDTKRAMNLRVDWPWYKWANDDDTIKRVLNDYGVLSVCVDATGWGSYSTGVYVSGKFETDPYSCTHAVALAGYGTDENGTPWWLIKNSWNTWWGEEGYMRLDATRDENGKIKGGIMLEYTYYPIHY